MNVRNWNWIPFGSMLSIQEAESSQRIEAEALKAV